MAVLRVLVSKVTVFISTSNCLIFRSNSFVVHVFRILYLPCSGGGFQEARWAVAHLEKKEGGQDYFFAHLPTRGGPLAPDTAKKELYPADHFLWWRRP